MKYCAGKKRLFGISVPLSSIKVNDGWAIGEYPDLVKFAKMASVCGASLVQILPVNDTGHQSSPYSALSAFALHPIYISVSDLAEVKLLLSQKESKITKKINKILSDLNLFAAKSNKNMRFNYSECLNAKMSALQEIFDLLYEQILSDKSLFLFIEQNEWVKVYSIFRRLKTENGEKSWREWKNYQNPTTEELDFLWNDKKSYKTQLFYSWLQFKAAQQFEKSAIEISKLKDVVNKTNLFILGDLPILLNDDSADVWINRKLFNSNKSAGAPPDMYSYDGQNWGFPIYDWEKMTEDGYSFWKNRILEADKYYSAFRIDHVLGFFRIWALSCNEETGVMGRFLPSIGISGEELEKAGFDKERVEWLSKPHISGKEIIDNCSCICDSVFTQIKNEDLYLFNPQICGEHDLQKYSQQIENTNSYSFLKSKWHDRTLFFDDGEYFPSWTYHDSTAWKSLSLQEKSCLQNLIDIKNCLSQTVWEERGRELLSMLQSVSGMLPCAEDLGAVPPCVPKVLEELGIPGLRVPRWTRQWDKEYQPFLPLQKYPELSLCVPAVHDSSTFRDSWENEEDRKRFVLDYCPQIDQKVIIDKNLSSKAELDLLLALSKANSMMFIIQIQDVFDLSEKFRSKNPKDDRINIPGTCTDWNWTWRMNVSIEELEKDIDLLENVRKLANR